MPSPAPTREIIDDYFETLKAGLCTYQCGRARDDICTCRCGGEFHNILRDWWGSDEWRLTGEHWCVTCQQAHPGALERNHYVIHCTDSRDSGR